MVTEQPSTTYIDDVAGSDADFRASFINIVKMEFPEEYQYYLKMYEEGNLTETASIVHKLKHKLNIVGLQEGYKLAVTYEEELKAGSAALHSTFLPVLDKAKEFITTLE